MSEIKANLHLEIAHILFIDVVDYSKLLVNEQSELLEELNEIVRLTEQVRAADLAKQLICLPTGDGMALVFRNHHEAPAECALEIAAALKSHPEIQVRMGVHSGPVNEVLDVNQRANIAGAGVNMAQRVMDCGDAGHILVSKRAADDLAQHRDWQPLLHDLGEVEVKHGVKILLANLYTDQLGNPARPVKLRGAKETAGGRRTTIAALILLAALAVGVGLWWSLGRTKRASEVALASAPASAPAISSKSIAVLPLENLSDDKENAFFADGIQDDLLTSLAKIKDLKVISRTSVMGYRDKAARNLKQIGKELGVANVLEGSVRRVSNRVLVNVQLIDTATDQHIWAERYDRTLADSITLQGELASEIAEMLHASLTPDERTSIERAPTENADAYALYLRALSFARLPTQEDIRTGVRLLEQALVLDPTFAAAWGQLAVSRAGLYQREKTEELKVATLNAAREALRLRPDQSEAHRALGAYYFVTHDFATALEECRLVLKALPNDAKTVMNMASVATRQGRWTEARAGFERAAALSPQEFRIWYNLSICASNQRDWPAVVRAQDRVLALAPDVVSYRIDRAKTEFYWKGDMAPLKSLLATISPGDDPGHEAVIWGFELAMWERDYDAGELILTSFPGEPFGQDGPKSFALGKLYRARNGPGDAQRAAVCLEAARAIFEELARKNPDEGKHHAHLGLVYASLGWRDAAVGEAEYAMMLHPEAKDATDGTDMAAKAAETFACLAEADLALPLIEHLLAVPTREMNIQVLRVSPAWDNLRSDPRFTAIIARGESMTVLPDRSKQHGSPQFVIRGDVVCSCARAT